MNDLVANLMKNADLDEAAAEKVIGVVKDFVEDKLPGPIASQVTNVLDGVDADDVGDALDAVKGLFGK